MTIESSVNYLSDSLLELQNNSNDSEELQNNRLKNLGILATSIVHDFNNILSVIIGSSDLLLQKTDLNSDLFKHAMHIRQGSNKASGLIKQLLHFVCDHHEKLEIFDMQNCMEEILSIVKRVIGTDITLITEISNHLDNISVDLVYFEQIIMNLVINAKEAIKHNGVIHIRAHNVEIPKNLQLQSHQNLIGCNVISEGNYLQLEVEDNGSGISISKIDDIFKPFVTSKKNCGGTGIGLSTVYNIVKHYSGYIIVETSAQGTKFTILLPKDTSQIVTKYCNMDNDIKQNIEFDHSIKNILIVDDDNDFRQVLSLILQDQNYHIYEAKMGLDALGIIKELNGTIDLVICDFVIKDIMGPKLIDQITSIYPNTKYIFMSGHNKDYIVKKHNLSQNIIFISKPFSIEDLSKAISSTNSSK